MAKKSDQERINELDAKMEQLKAKKQQLFQRERQRERKARTKRLIEVGAIFEKYFEIEGTEQAEQIALGVQSTVKEHKEKLLRIDVEQSKETGDIITKNNL